jgi:tetratricopeptide (TPR) repeat protein
MALKQELETWTTALAAYDKKDYNGALSHLSRIAASSKVLFNMGVISATTGNHDEAIEFLEQAVALDAFFAVAYYQMGVSLFLLEDYEAALRKFQEAFKNVGCDKGPPRLPHGLMGFPVFMLHS